MAKNKLDWFKLDCQCDDKIELIEAEFGLTGFAVVVRLWQKIYGGEGYYCEWNDDVALMFARKNGLGVNVVSEIVIAALKRGIFDLGMFKTRGILTSHGIQVRYYDCTNRRKGEKIKPQYLLLESAQLQENADISSENADISNENADISDTEEKRTEENRTNENRVDKTRAEETPASFPPSPPSISARAQLIYDYGQEAVDRYVKRVQNWYADKGKPVTDLEGTVRKWLEQDGVQKIDHSIDKYKVVINKF